MGWEQRSSLIGRSMTMTLMSMTTRVIEGSVIRSELLVVTSALKMVLCRYKFVLYIYSNWSQKYIQNVLFYNSEYRAPGPPPKPSSTQVRLFFCRFIHVTNDGTVHGIFDHRRSGVVYNVGRICLRLCVYVCLSVCLCVCLSDDNFRKPWSSYLQIRISLGNTGEVRIWRSSGQGQGHRSEKVENFYSRNVKLRVAITLVL